MKSPIFVGWPLALSILLLVAARSSAQFTFKPVGQITAAGAYANDVAVAGKYAYVTYEPTGLLVYDISNPSKPTFVRGVANGTSPEGLVVSGDFIYLANWTDGLRVYNISDPTNMVNICHTNNGGQAWNLALKDNLLCLANGSDGLRIYDISNPTNVANVSHTNDGGIAYNVAVSGNYAFLANGSDGLRVYDISNPTNVINVGHTNDGTANGIAVSGIYAFVLHWSPAGLVVYDVSNPADPKKVSQIAGYGTQPSFHQPVVSGTFIYMTMSHALRVFDQSDPSHLVEVGHTNLPSSPYDPSGWALSGDYLYVASQALGFRIYSLAGPKLSITTTATNTALVTWPSNYLTFTLLQNSNLTTANWTPVAATDTFTNNQHQVTVPLSNAGSAYRLKLQ